MPVPEVEFCGEITYESENSYLVFDGMNKVWLPKSQVIEKRKIKGRDYEFTIPQWLAELKGII